MRAMPARTISGVRPHGVPSPGVVLTEVLAVGWRKTAPVRCVRSGGGASRKTLPDTPSSCCGIAVGACHCAPAIQADGGAPMVVEDEAGVRVREGVLGVGVLVEGVACGTALAVTAVAGSRRCILCVRSALLGMLAGGTNISAEENSASATLSSTVMAAAKSRQAAQPPA